MFLVPLALVLVLFVAAGVAAYRTMSAFDDVHSVSTPPPEVSGLALGGDEDLVIDTGPAQEAIRQRQERDQQRSEGTQAPLTQPEDAQSTALVQDQASRSTQSTQPSQSGQSEQPGTEQAPEGDSQTPSAFDSVNDSQTNDQPQAPPTDSEETVAAGDDAANRTSALPVDTGGTNILLMGVDARDGESIDVGVRPDALAVLHLEEGGTSCRILAVPRDSRVAMPGYGMSKINHALAVGGIPYELQVMEDYLGIEIGHYALIDFSGVTQVVDGVGGVTVDNPEAFTIGGVDFAAGTLQLDGEEALLYSRYRGGADGDFGRISKQQQVLRAIINQVSDANLVTLIPNMFSLLSDHFRTDYGATDLLDLANTYRDRCTSETLETRTIPGDVGMHFDDMMQMELSFVVSDPAVVQESVTWLLGVDE